MLQQRGLQGVDSRYRAMEAAGGLFIVPPDAPPDAVRDEVLARRIRALEVQAPDLGFLEGLPIEYLFLNVPLPDIRPVNGLDGLRCLVVDAWTGDLELWALPALRWFTAGEPERAQVDRLLEQGHAELDHLAIGRWPRQDLTGLTRFPRLSHLDVGDSRFLVRLEGARQLPRLRVLELYACRALAGLEGIEDTGLEHVGIETCNKVTDLAPLASLPRLRSVQIELRRPPSLAPLRGHPTLEFVWLLEGRRPAEELAALRELSSARIIDSSHGMWLRPDRDWYDVRDIYAMSDEQQAVYERLHGERNAVKSW